MRLRSTLFTLLLLASPHARASAQEATEDDTAEADDTEVDDTEPSDESASPAYGRWIDLAISEFADSHYAEAFAAFHRAHETYANARALRGMAMASYELRNYPAALRHGEAAMASEERSLTPELRVQVEEIVLRSRAFVGIYQIELTPVDAVVRVDADEEAWEHEAGRLILGLGDHEIRVTAEGFEALERRLTVTGGEQNTLRFEMSTVEAPIPEPVAARGPAVPPLRSAENPPALPSAAVDGVALLVLGSGIAAVLASLGSAVWLDNRSATLDECRTSSMVFPAACGNFPTLEAERDASIGLTISLGAAGLGLVSAGIALLLAE